MVRKQTLELNFFMCQTISALLALTHTHTPTHEVITPLYFVHKTLKLAFCFLRIWSSRVTTSCRCFTTDLLPIARYTCRYSGWCVKPLVICYSVAMPTYAISLRPTNLGPVAWDLLLATCYLLPIVAQLTMQIYLNTRCILPTISNLLLNTCYPLPIYLLPTATLLHVT